ncbi:MAG: alpha/beta hydrolase [Chlamydiota bacterium]
MYFILLAANLLLMSDRDLFWDADKIAQTTEISWDQSTSRVSTDVLRGKKILVLVHGFNNDAKDALSTYRTINEHFSTLLDADGNNFYDLVIGYLWPGCDEGLDYYYAKKNVRKLASRMRSHLTLFDTYASQVDVLAHSMGNYLVLEALDFSTTIAQTKPVRIFYSIAPAIDNESIEEGETYYNSTQNCEKFFVFHSTQDKVLHYLYSASEFDKALGFEGVENIKKLPCNVQLVDCSSFALGHSAYFTANALYDFIRNQLLQAK